MDHPRTCNACNLTFETYDEYMTHILRNHAIPLVQCKECEELFFEAEEFAMHMVTEDHGSVFGTANGSATAPANGTVTAPANGSVAVLGESIVAVAAADHHGEGPRPQENINAAAAANGYAAANGNGNGGALENGAGN